MSPSDLESSILAAKVGGFEGVEVSPKEIADRLEIHGPESIKGRFDSEGIRPAGWGLPTAWRGSEQEFASSLRELPRLARACAAMGATRTFTWIMPMSDELDLARNTLFHVSRLKPVADVLAEAGCRFGLEFIGPKTLRDKGRHPFVYTSSGMLELAAQIGSNVGLLLDCWHWYTSGGTLADLAEMSNQQIVYVHVNDAPAGIARDAQLDNVRALPGETGVIDIGGFMAALRRIGYDGPVVPEPFKNELAALPTDEARLHAVGESMRRIWS